MLGFGSFFSLFFFFNDTATTEIYTLSLHDALPIYPAPGAASSPLPFLPTSTPRCPPQDAASTTPGSAAEQAPSETLSSRVLQARGRKSKQTRNSTRKDGRSPIARVPGT